MVMASSVLVVRTAQMQGVRVRVLGRVGLFMVGFLVGCGGTCAAGAVLLFLPQDVRYIKCALVPEHLGDGWFLQPTRWWAAALAVGVWA